MEEPKRYEEDQELPHPWEWVIIVLFSAALAGYGLLVYHVVPDTVRIWDFGQLPDTPAESIYSTDLPRSNAKPPRQIHKLPEAQPLNPSRPGAEPPGEQGPNR
ncbi:hypothetical protein [Geobacter sp. SVR]|uniref:hypothetical protein n=1 Tax=Geobacter sp. SVR TaxID=2495594 RepID=UPI00143EFD8F|nr:hypothetical protein [Geobacter sp. SVR]BCS54204.1 hypothetical protein GSVR_25120 [Geobacter sp. SVR]GCF85937.1 hypothetical protein GSbR_25370 [Geobacter sp. SVR]